MNKTIKKLSAAILATAMSISGLLGTASAIVLPDGGEVAAGTASYIEGWSSVGTRGQVYMESYLSKSNYSSGSGYDKVTCTMQVLRPAGAQVGKLSMDVNITYHNGTTLTKTRNSNSGVNLSSLSCAATAPNIYATEGRAGVVMIDSYYGTWYGGLYTAF